MDMSKVVMLGDRICLKKVVETKEREGILMPSSKEHNEPAKGVVISKGTGMEEEYSKVMSSINEGDTVMFQAFNAIPVKNDGEMFYIVAVKDILAKV